MFAKIILRIGSRQITAFQVNFQITCALFAWKLLQIQINAANVTNYTVSCALKNG